MELLPRISRQTIRIGSSDACEICLSGVGVAPVHAEVIHQGGGHLLFVPGASGRSFIEGRPLPPGVGVPFDFRTQFSVGDVPVPLTHDDLCLMVMSPGHMKPAGAELIVGRDPERCHLVLSSPGVSGVHAILRFLDTFSVIDQGSTSGTWRQGKRLVAREETRIGSDELLALGPLPLPVRLAQQIHKELSAAQSSAPFVARTEAMPRRTAALTGKVHRLPSMPMAKHRTVMGTIRMSQASTSTIGRTPDNDIVLDYAQVSSRHARLISIGDDLFLEDAGSELGTSVRGTRLKPGQRARVKDGERVLFGPMSALICVRGDSAEIVVEDHQGWAGRPLFDVSAAHLYVVVPDRDDPRKQKTLLRDVSFRARPGDLVALMGPSGSGKTTLLHALTGYVRPAQGEVLINDNPLPQVFESLRGSLGYVPQDDILHPELTVFEAVRYSARFRLPSDYSEEEIDRRVRATLVQLGLESVAELRIGQPEHKIISGGQRKRVNIAMELVTDPVLLFLDEPTSGLAADDATALVDLLSRLSTEHGKTIVATIHQPARDEYEKFNLALVLGHGGIQLYFGPSVAGYEFFEAWRGPTEMRGITTPRDMFAELSERQARLSLSMPEASAQQVREAVSKAFFDEYQKSEIRGVMAAASRGVAEEARISREMISRSRPRGQLRLLLSRYLKIKSRDRVGTAILMLQAPLIGLLLSLVFGAKKDAVPYWCLGALNHLATRSGKMADATTEVLRTLTPTADQSGALFFLVIAAVWFGTSNAAREVVGERAIFRRERMVNLGVGNYVMSKFLVLSALCVLQCAILLAIVFVTLDLSGGANTFWTILGTMTLTAFSSVALGLLLSAAVTSSEAAMALTPIALIPQVVLGGIMVPVTTNPWLKYPMMLMPSRWGFEGVVTPERNAIADQPGFRVPLPDAPDSPPDFLMSGYFDCARAQMQSSELPGAWGFSGPQWMVPVALSGMTFVLLAMVVIVLSKRR
jgi:ABC-type multidrug transport system ATPase subunit/pSer/pThr/pTyr-binding forkhead associated (FHA) protein